LCIVNSSDDLNKIEQTESYNGLYYVLWEEIDAKNKKISEPVIKKLLSLVSENEIKEIIIATNWTTSGELTASYLKNLFDQVKPQINIFRLAVGLPINSAIDYADNTTLKYALINKTKY
jgi:recombination protein RecR